MQKFLVSLLNEDGTTKEQREFKKAKDISSSLDIEYHTIRTLMKIQQQPEEARPKMHPKTLELMKKLKIEVISPTPVIKGELKFK